MSKAKAMTEREYKDQIYKKADKVKSKPDLNALLKEIVEFNHDYGTIVYGCMAAMKAAFNVVNNGPQGGITGFQAGCLGWECVREFLSIRGPAKLLDYENMLFPQYRSHFTKTISASIWRHLQSEAKKNLAEPRGVSEVRAHWQSIVDGRVPFGYRVEEDDK